jgi:transcriptional regulator with XRE-family HTH domain
MTFAEKLQALRAKAGLSQSQLAKASGIPVWTIRGYEQGRREPLWNAFFRLAHAVGTTCEAFADCVNAAPVPKRPAIKASPGVSMRPRRRLR